MNKGHLLIKSCFMLFLIGAPLNPSWALDDAILAIVNEDVITARDLRENMKGLYAQLRIEGRSPQEINQIMTEYETKGIDQLVEDRLILSEAKKLGVIIRPQVIDERLEEIKSKYSTYQEFLAAIRKEGITISEIRKKIENQISGQAVVNDSVRSKVYVHPQEVTNVYNANPEQFKQNAKVFLGSIFIKSVFGRDEALQKVNTVKDMIDKGHDFDQVAADHSDLPSVGEIPLEKMRAEFREQIDHMNIGDVSKIIEVPNGFYILKLKSKTEAKIATLLDVKEAIYQQIFEQKFKDAFLSWINELRQKSYVDIKR